MSRLEAALKGSRVSLERLVVYGALISIVALGVLIRLMPLKWGIYLDEFDPYIQYKGAQYVVENGFDAWYTWYDPTRWAPWGVDQSTAGLPGVPFAGAVAYLILNFLGLNIPLFDVVVFFPVFAGGLMILLGYLLGKELVNRGVGLLTALVLAIDVTAIQRTSLGFFDTESVGMVGMLVALIFFLKSMKRRTIPYAIISGLGLALMALSWRGYLYTINFLALYVVLMILIGKWSRAMTTSFAIVSSITLFTVAVTPSYGYSILISPYTIGAYVAIFVCLIRALTEEIRDQEKRLRVSIGIIIGVMAIAGVLVFAGFFGDITGKFLSIVDPFSRVGGEVRTVGEQLPSIWVHFFQTYRSLVVLAPLGVLYAMRRLSGKGLFMALFAITSLYGAGSFVRLLIFVAPALAVVSGYALSSILDTVRPVLKHEIDRKSKASLLSKSYGIFTIALLAGAMLPMVIDSPGIRSADRPAMIVSASTGANREIPDWIEAIAWIRDNVPEDAVIGCWWDYGYWINVMANKSVIDDNATINGTQIALVAKAFLNNESVSLEIFKQLNVSYVVVYEPFTIVSTSPLLGLPPWYITGDFEKSTAMMVWAGYNSSEYIASVPINLGGSYVNYPLPAGAKAANTTLYQLLFYPYREAYNSTLGIKITAPEHYKLVFISPSNGWVMVYKINYPSTA
ncbi:MAG: STT3 domain-containing protein [Candidatus Verstraetearchaeota archaeon]|nr:STT3 domain-containing protein [Candidatus Verstraetearchaeota archaeon]